jgi:hypothetical protein
MNQGLRTGLLVLPLVLGCGPGSGTVSGKVLYGGKPLPGGTVTFYPEQGGGLMAGIGGDGSYVVDVPVGGAKIAVQIPRAGLRRRPEKGGARQAGFEKEMQEHATIVIPPEYADPGKSGLSLKVERGRQTHDILIPDRR